MEDRRELIEKKYGFQVKNQYRARGAILFDTKDGPLLLREKMKLTGHFEWENEVKEHLRKNGMTLLDFCREKCGWRVFDRSGRWNKICFVPMVFWRGM